LAQKKAGPSQSAAPPLTPTFQTLDESIIPNGHDRGGVLGEPLDRPEHKNRFAIVIVGDQARGQK